MVAVRSGQRLGEPLGFVVDPARPDRIDVAPVVFRLRMDQRIAVDLGGRGEHEAWRLLLGQAQGMDGADRPNLQCVDR